MKLTLQKKGFSRASMAPAANALKDNMKLSRLRGMALAGVIGTFWIGESQGAQILIGGFSGGETVEDFTSLGGIAPPDGPFTLGNLTFSEATTGSGNAPGWRILSLGTPQMLTDDGGSTRITIDLGTPQQRVGLDVGIGTALYDVSFFDTDLALLGTVNVALSGQLASAFAGWEDLGGISRVTVTELGDNVRVGGVDNIRFEGPIASIPEPSSTIVTGLIAVFGLSMRRRR